MDLRAKRIGHIHILELLGEGGLGRVYVGYDEKLERRVALKVLHESHRLHPKAKARLLREARILSQLDHPNICRIYGFLEEEEGDFLVLELIEGRNLRQAIADGLEPGERMRIAEQIVKVLVAAHSRGVIHRDLKPENVMLTPQGKVKLLDFGLARHLDDEPSTVESRDQVLHFRGTAAFTSPEQAQGEEATAASDMYSFGILFQELLTGSPAYEAGLPLPQLLLRVTQANTEPVASGNAELDALIERLKSRAPAARPTAVDTAERLYRLRRRSWQRRRRMLISAALVVLLLSFLATAFLAHRLAREAERANRERERANREATAANQVADFLVDLLAMADPESPQSAGADATAREILDRGARRVLTELADQPRTQAHLMDRIGMVYQRLGLFAEAEKLLHGALEIRQQTLGDQHPEVGESILHLALLARRKGLYVEAEKLYERAVELFGGTHGENTGSENTGGENDPKLAEGLNGLAVTRWSQGDFETAEKLYRQALEIRLQSFEGDHLDVAASLDNLAIALTDQKRYAEAEPLYRQALAMRQRLLGPRHSRVARSLNNLSFLLLEKGEHEEAEARLEAAIAIWRETLPENHPLLASGLINLGFLLLETGRAEAAGKHFHDALARLQVSLEPGHPSIGYCLLGLGRVSVSRGENEAAADFFSRALEILESRRGRNHPDTVLTLARLAAAKMRLGDASEAAALFAEARKRLPESPQAADDPELLELLPPAVEVER